MYVLTHAEALAGAAATQGWLASRGIEAGQRIAVAPPVPTGADAASQRTQAMTVQVVLGCLHAGVTPVMVNPWLSETDRAYVLENCRPAHVLTDAAAFEDVLAPGPPSSAPAASDQRLRARPMHYTSGTTGQAKGVWSGSLSDSEIVEWWADEASAWPFNANDVTLVNGPLAHSAPLRFAILTLAAGGNAVLPGVFNAELAAQAISQHRPTTAFAAPTHLQRILAQPSAPESSFRLLAHAGAVCPVDLKQRIHEWAGIDNVWEFYGSTEGQFTTCPGREWVDRPGTLGRARPGRELFIDEGVIWCVAPTSSSFEYWGDPDKTQAAWRELPDGRRAFSVGDLGHLDAEGYLWMDGRRDDLIITGGVNVYPVQVEAVVDEVDGVVESAVFGAEDEEWGQVVCVAYVGDREPDSVLDAVRPQLAKFQVPKRAFKVDDLPRTVFGKVKRRELPELLIG